jgi:hypothetical protein
MLVPIITAGPSKAAQPVQPPIQPSNVVLSNALRAFLVDLLPNPLYEASPGWGNTAPALTGVKWKGKGGYRHLSGKHSKRNQGTWRKVRITANPKTVVVEIRDIKQEAGRTTFSLFIALDAHVDYVRQKWASGIKLLDQSVRARLHVKVPLQCEFTSRLEMKDTIIPDMVFRLRVLSCNLQYDNVVCEHFAGFGGTTAKVVGEIVMNSLHKWHPSIERNLLAKANAAIVKAGDTKEVRIELGKLLGK